MIKLFRNLWKASVFPRIHPLQPNEYLAVLFHRAASITYLMLSLWGIITAFGGIPALIATSGNLWQITFSFLVFIATVPAFVGASFFPKLAMLELLSASSFIALIVIFIGILVVSGLRGDLSHLGGSFVIGSVAVFPGARCLFIYKTLVMQGKK